MGDALPGILGSMISIIFRAAAEVVGFVSRELWILFGFVAYILFKMVEKIINSKNSIGVIIVD